MRCASTQYAHATSSHIDCAAHATAIALGGGAAVIVLMILAVGTLRWPVGVVLGWIVQLTVVAAGFLVPAFFIVGAIFTAMWTYCMIAAARIDRNQRAAAAHNGTENP